MEPFPLSGSWAIRADEVRPSTIHGDVYYEVHGERTDGPATVGSVVLRIAEHALSTPPVVGVRLRVTFLMGQVTAAVAE